MRIKFWGVRGSLPIPGEETLKYGGNTPCIEIINDDEEDKRIILDAGSGLKALGQRLITTKFGEGKGKGYLFLSHYHWDHIQGFPFFAPFFAGEMRKDGLKIKGHYNEFTVYGPKPKNISLEKVVIQLMSDPFFPLPLDKLNAIFEFKEIEPGDSIDLLGIKISTVKLNHPGGGVAYRFDSNDASFVYATDTEPQDEDKVDNELLMLAKKAKVLIYDSTYTPEEYTKRKGWGHSTWKHGVKLAKEAKVDKLILFHHDLDHSDKILEQIEEKAKKEFSLTEMAREGVEIQF